MTSRRPRAFHFDPDICAALQARLRCDDSLIADLESAASNYLVSTSQQDVTRPARRRRDVRRIKRAIESADPWVRHNLKSLCPELEAVLGRSAQGRPGRPRENRRHQLEFAIGRALHHHGIKLTVTRDGKLAYAIQSMLYAVSNRNLLQDALKTCRRVRDQVLAEASAQADFDRVFRQGQ